MEVLGGLSFQNFKACRVWRAPTQVPKSELILSLIILCGKQDSYPYMAPTMMCLLCLAQRLEGQAIHITELQALMKEL